MTKTARDLPALLEALDPEADLVHRHLWLIELLDWIRGPKASASTAIGHIEMLLDVLEARPETRAQFQHWWRQLLTSVELSSLLSDYGFSARNAFVSELVQRLHHRWLPASPQTTDAAELFALVMSHPQDAQWLSALPPALLQRLAFILTMPSDGHHVKEHPGLTHWQDTLLDALTFCTSQIRATGFSPEIRLRMDSTAREHSPFRELTTSFDSVRDAWLSGQGLTEAALAYTQQLDACNQAASTVYQHLDAHGISVDLVFRLRQLRDRIGRARTLLTCLLDDAQHQHAAQLLSHLATREQDLKSVGALIQSSSSLLAAKVAERNSETGEHYITRDLGEYRTMLNQAAGGGVLTALTTALKFAVMALGLSAFWYGFWAGVVYAASFVLIQLLHFTLATKQPAMTAPAMAAKLKDVSTPQALDAFVDEVAHLVRSQTAAVIGNVALVFPATILLALGVQQIRGAPMIDEATAHYVLHSLTLQGPSVLYAAFTGVLLFSSSILAGWVENWFVLHRLDSAMRYNPRFTAVLGVKRAARWARFWRHNISGLAANISLGFIMGLTPSIMGFFAIPLDVRHVTLSSGQLGAACATLGTEVLQMPEFWWAVAAIPLIGLMNVSVSYYFAFRVALRAHDVSDIGRSLIYKSIGRRLLSAPLSFVWPVKSSTT
ncbi:recombinase [Rhodoferax lacus]|uniref:Recombinase n=1 Tax=Rhodoferax lacus TaxID=2184758 RepID=A0A3E1R9T8_9BURK|nr:site-specific recombinase [Rhodoferax lacus]RFO96107.1 recombinase [Rhodoferax lacus]